MERATNKPFKTSSNISDMVSKFAKACKLRSIGVFSTEYPNHHPPHPSDNLNGPSVGEDSSIATKETACDGERIYPQPVVVPNKSAVSGEEPIVELFDKISALKFAYVQLQEAHVPYDPDKIVAADSIFVGMLEELGKIKGMHKEKQVSKTKLDSSLLDCVQTEVKLKERELETLKSQCREKDAELVHLRKQLRELDVGNGILAEKIQLKISERMNLRTLNISIFEDTYKRALKSIHDFGKPLISLMKASGWNLHLAANSIESQIFYTKRSDRKYAFEAYIARRMFHGMSLKSYPVDDVMRFNDPIDSLIAYPNSGFAEFCGKKYLFVVHPVMEMSFFGNLDQRMFVLGGKHPRTPFYEMFARMAKWVWILQGIATAIDPCSEIYYVSRGSNFSDVYMESVEEPKEGAVWSNGRRSNLKVELMIMPGFKIGDALVKSHVYVSSG